MTFVIHFAIRYDLTTQEKYEITNHDAFYFTSVSSLLAPAASGGEKKDYIKGRKRLIS